MTGSDLCGARYEALDRRTPVIVPVARFIGRGEGVPLGLESDLLGMILDQLTGPVIALPVIPFAASPENFGVPGSISLPIGVSQQIIQSLLSTLSHDRFERILLLSASPMVSDWLRPSVLEFRGHHPSVAVAVVSIVELANRPDAESTLVRLASSQAMVKANPRIPSLALQMPMDNPKYLATLTSELAPNGYLANPEDDAAGEDGPEVEMIVRNLEKFLENFVGPIIFAEN